METTITSGTIESLMDVADLRTGVARTPRRDRSLRLAVSTPQTITRQAIDPSGVRDIAA
jgi:hypothetical protein